VLDAKGKIVYVNPALEKMLDVAHAGLLGSDATQQKYLRRMERRCRRKSLLARARSRSGGRCITSRRPDEGKWPRCLDGYEAPCP